jgi:hypothetical protein
MLFLLSVKHFYLLLQFLESLTVEWVPRYDYGTDYSCDKRHDGQQQPDG